jgi:hypothetical protein
MFETLFKYPRVLARHREGPVADARERFLTHCAEQGLARESLLRTAREVLIIAKHIDLTTGTAISIHDVEAAADRWDAHQQRRYRLRGSAVEGSRQLFIQKALPWLRFLGRLEQPDNEPIPFADLLKDFAAYMRNQRGLSAVTIRNRCWHVETFLDWFTELNRSFAEVSIGDVDAFLSLKAGQGWSRVSLATNAEALRSFFRHAEVRSWCAVGLASGIDGPRVFKQEGLPVGPSWADVERLIMTASGDQPRDIRDHAILLLFAFYALRSAEVAGLRLEDLNWEREIIVVARPGSISFFVCESFSFSYLVATKWRPDLSIIAPGRAAARMPGTGPLRRSSGPARKKAIVGKSRVAANPLRSPASVFVALAITGFIVFRSPRQRISDQSEWQIGWLPISK